MSSQPIYLDSTGTQQILNLPMPPKRRGSAKPLSKEEFSALSPDAQKKLRSALRRKKSSYGTKYSRRVGGRGAYNIDDSKVSNKDLAQNVGGRVTGWLWDKIFGQGDYASAPNFALKSNSLMEKMIANGPPEIWSTSDNQFIIRHREYIGDVITSDSLDGAFKLESYDINPGLSQTFPWLSTIASSFQQYEMKGCLFQFLSTSADALNSTNTSLGTVIMATNYNSVEPDFANKIQMLQTEFVSAAKPSCSALHPIECAPQLSTLSRMYVRSGQAPEGSDLRMYDLGRFQIATVGMQGSSVNIGELWVTFEIAFYKPIVSPSNPFSTATDLLYATTGITALVPFGTNPQFDSSSSLGCTYSSANPTRITFSSAQPSDVYLLQAYATCSSGAITLGTVSTSGCSTKDLFNDFSVGQYGCPSSGVTDVQYSWSTVVQMSTSINQEEYPYLEWAPATLPTTSSICLIITRLNPNINGPALDEIEFHPEPHKLGKVEKKLEVSEFAPVPKNQSTGIGSNRAKVVSNVRRH